MDCGGWDYLLQSKGNILYFVAIANSTMDSSTKMIEDVVVDSLPNCNAQPVIVNSPSLLKAKSMTLACIQGSFNDSRSFHKFYNILSSSLSYRVSKVFSKIFTSV